MTVCPWRYTCWEQLRFIKEPVCLTWSVIAAGHKGDEVQAACWECFRGIPRCGAYPLLLRRARRSATIARPCTVLAYPALS
jgi:hypothetical protein